MLAKRQLCPLRFAPAAGQHRLPCVPVLTVVPELTSS